MSAWIKTNGVLHDASEAPARTAERLYHPSKCCPHRLYDHFSLPDGVAAGEPKYGACTRCDCKARIGYRCEDHGPDEKCSYCGSMSVVDAIAALARPGTRYSGSDWKYGWPHKFYIGDGKFYAIHLKRATAEQLAAFNAAAEKTIGVTYFIEVGGERDGAFGYRCPRPDNFCGFQRDGVVTPAA